MPDEPQEGRRDSRINIDLKILQDESIKRLEEFGKQFDRSASQILRGLEKLGGAAVVPGVGPSAAASIATDRGFSTGGFGGGAIQNLAAAGASGGGGGPSSSASVAGGDSLFDRARSGFGGMGFAGPNISEFQRAQLRLGNFPSYGMARGLMTASWMAGTLGWQHHNPSQGEIDAGETASGQALRQDADGHWFAQRSAAAVGASNFLGTAGQAWMRGTPVAQRIMSHILPVGAGMGLVPMGMEAGHARGSGLPFFSPAWRHAMGMQWTAAKESWFGFNPNYSRGQAMAAQEAIQTAGYGSTGGPYGAQWLAGQLRTAQQNLSMDPQSAMAFYDPALRFGGDPNSVQSQLKALSAAAKAAHIGLSQFGSSLIGVAQQVSAQTGIPVQTIGGAVQAMSAAMGMNPSALSGFFDPKNVMTGTLLSGMHPWQTMYTGNPGATVTAAAAMPNLMLRSITGGQKWDAMGLARKHQVMDTLAWYYQNNPNAFGGLTPQQVLTMMNHRLDPFRAARGLAEVQHGGANMSLGISDFSAGNQAVRAQLMHIWQTSNHDKKRVIDAMSKIMGKNNEDASRTLEVTLSPQARKLLRFMKDNPSETNKGSSDWHIPIQIGETVARAGLGMIPGVGGALSSLIP